MKTLIRATCLALAISAGPVFAEVFSLEDYSVSIKNSAGGSFGATSLSGEFGLFSAGFTPTTGNTASWLANFTVAPNTVSYIDATGPEWNIGFKLTSNAAPFAANSQLFLWVHNSTAVAATSQWLLLTDSSWKVTSYDPLNFPVALSFTASTVAQFGSYNASDLYVQTASAVPEPSTYAVILGLATLGFVGVRRFRRR